MSYFVTVYNNYPIYEAAEGGYYYEGTEVVKSREFQTWRKAKRAVRKLYKKLFDAEDLGSFQNDSRQHFGWNSRYIGDGWYIKLERRQGGDVSGYHLYE